MMTFEPILWRRFRFILIAIHVGFLFSKKLNNHVDYSNILDSNKEYSCSLDCTLGTNGSLVLLLGQLVSPDWLKKSLKSISWSNKSNETSIEPQLPADSAMIIRIVFYSWGFQWRTFHNININSLCTNSAWTDHLWFLINEETLEMRWLQHSKEVQLQLDVNIARVTD